MKKYFKYYAICWVITLAMFNVVVFVIAGNTIGLANAGASFWIAYAFITLVFCGNLGCSALFFKEENKNKTFLKLSVMHYAFCALAVSLIVGAIAMAIPQIPYWVGIVIDVLVLAFYAIAITKAVAAADIINTVEQKVSEKTAYIRRLTLDAKSLVSDAKLDETKKLAKNVYEAIRFSDPMSTPQLNEIETRIGNEFAAFSEAVKNDDFDLATTSSEELISLVNERNNKCVKIKKEN